MARRPPPPDPELTALARDRLARLLGGPDVARRAARAAPSVPLVPSVRADDPGSPPRRVGAVPVGVEDLVPPRRFTRWHLGVVAIVLVVGLVWGGWSWFRARPEAVAAPPAVSTASAAVSGSPAPAGASAGASSTAAEASGLVVHVLGAVRHPGLVRLRAGARVEDAIEHAGGLSRDADPGELNLAQPLDDGVQVVVGTRRHPAGEVRTSDGGTSGGGTSGGGSGGTGSGTGASGTGSVGATVDLNRASVDQLDTLPGVGPVTAQKIADWRTQHGRFTRTEELQEVDGIGPKTYARIAPHVRV